MGIFDSFRKKQEAKQEQTTPPPAGHTLAEFLNDKNRSVIFGRLLERNGHEDLALRMARKELEPGDEIILNEQRLILSEKITHAKNIEKNLTKEMIVDFARNNPAFETIVNNLGPEKAAKVIKSQLEEVSVTDPDRFDAIVANMKTMEDYKKGDYKKREDDIIAMCEKNKIDPSDYMEAIGIDNSNERREALRQLAKKKYGWFRSSINFVSRGNFSRKGADKLVKHRSGIMTSLSELNTHFEAIGSTLHDTVSGNDDMRNAFSYELAGEVNPKEVRFGFKETKPQTEAEIETAWATWKTAQTAATGVVWNTISPTELNNQRDAFVASQKHAYETKNEKNTGFWHSIFSSVLESVLTSKKSNLK